jgi:hypothetical protein
MHDSPELVILQRGENRVKFGKELAFRCVSTVESVSLKISTRFALHSPDESW